MSNFNTPIALENEIFKAADFNFGYDSIISNVAAAMKAFISGSEGNYVIGGTVVPYKDGGLNVSIAPIFVYCNSTDTCVVESCVTEPVSFEEADSELDRIDIIEVCGTETGYDLQSRKFIDPSTGTETTQIVNTKKKIALTVVVKKGSNGSEAAPNIDEGYIKLAEVRIPAGTNNITEDLIRNIDAKKYGVDNTEWTTDKTATFNPSYFANIFHTFLENHNENGSHRSSVIKAANIDFGTGNAQVKGSNIPTGQSMGIHGLNFTSQQSVTELIVSLASNVTALYKYSNDILSRFSFLKDVPVAASTENIDIVTGGEKTIDGVSCKIGQIVFLKNQENAVENGLYKVQTGAWNRYTGYTVGTSAFVHKFVFVPAGTKNIGKIFYINADAAIIGTDELNFIESMLSPYSNGNSIMIRDASGRAQIENPVNDKDIANKAYTDNVVTEKSNAVQTNLTSHINNKSNPHEVSLTQLGVTATATELNKLDGFTGSASKLNFTNGLTSDAQTQLNSKATTASLNAHTGATTGVHGATSAPTANRIAIRDASGRMQVASPSVGNDIANKTYVDTKVTGRIPIGFIYIQFKGQSDPTTLFGGTWQNISSQFAGEFFRAEGGNAATFGSSQAQSTQPHTHSFSGTTSSNGVHSHEYVKPNNPENKLNPDSGSNAVRGISTSNSSSSGNHTHTFSGTTGSYGSTETRPVNSTIRIWKRTA